MYRKEYKQQLATITARDQIAAPSCNMRTHAQNEYMPQAKSVHSQRTAMWQPCSTPDHGLRKTPTVKPCRDPCPLITSNPRTPHLPSQNLSPLPTCVQIVGGKEEDRSRRTAFKMMSQSKGARKDNSSNSPESAPVVRKNHSNPRQNAKGKAIEVRHFGREECMDTAKIQNSTRSTHGRRVKPPAQPQRAPHPSPMPTRARPTVGHTKLQVHHPAGTACRRATTSLLLPTLRTVGQAPALRPSQWLRRTPARRSHRTRRPARLHPVMLPHVRARCTRMRTHAFLLPDSATTTNRRCKLTNS